MRPSSKTIRQLSPKVETEQKASSRRTRKMRALQDGRSRAEGQAQQWTPCTARPQGKSAATSKSEEIRRPHHFPYSGKLERLLESYDPNIGYFELDMKRRNARALRTVLCGPKGLRKVPKGEGTMEFKLRRGWTLRLRYDAKPAGFGKAGVVTAEFIPPSLQSKGCRHRSS